MVALHTHALEVEPQDGWQCWKPFGSVKVDDDCDLCRAGIPMKITRDWRGHN